MLKVARIETRAAVCLDSQMTEINIPKYQLPMGVKPGDNISMDNMGMYVVFEENEHKEKEKSRLRRFMR